MFFVLLILTGAHTMEPKWAGWDPEIQPTSARENYRSCVVQDFSASCTETEDNRPRFFCQQLVQDGARKPDLYCEQRFASAECRQNCQAVRSLWLNGQDCDLTVCLRAKKDLEKCCALMQE
eukprot:gnl/Spiro4/28017_TR13874_c0_g4_i1.p2 gnl/Spiro4/28017_TR13874_c0_g4~~gnl/Spiro4/28017_TR13874_c0_g4_i1.p2  ORF type:complete len:136 (-),score=24.83 gnl/Spiro4/28017_TR13874_c0_g4_i1:70-432(-)